MAKKRTQSEDDGPPGVGDWIVTFSDCMTLLLCFFVLLLTFSSFDEESLKRFGGAFAFDQIRPGVEERPRPKDGMVEPYVNVIDKTRDGSETASKAEKTPESRARPKSRWTPEDAAYLDKKIVHIPSARLFVPHTDDLSDRGKRLLDSIRAFLDKMPSRVVISENTPREIIGSRVIGGRCGLNRAWAIVEFLTADRTLKDANGKKVGVMRGIRRDQFSVSEGQLAPVLAGRGGVVEIAMLGGKGQV